MSGLAEYKRTLAAGRRESIGARGATVILRSSPYPVIVTARSSKVGSGSGLAYSLTMYHGDKWFCATEFDSIEVENHLSGESMSVELLIGYGDYQFPPPSLSTSDLVRALPLAAATGGPSEWLVAPQNFKRWRVHLRASHLNATNVKVGGEGGVQSGGIQLAPGASLTLETRGAIYAYDYDLSSASPNARIEVIEEYFR